MRVLHFVFGSVSEPRHKFLGTTKDIRGRTQYFCERGITCQELVLESRTEAGFQAAIASIELAQFDAVIVEGTYFPRALATLRRRGAHLKILVRGINAEFLHWLDSAHAALRFDTWRRVAFDLRSAFVFGLKDLRSARRANTLLAISDWEVQHYWPWLERRAQIAAMPYFLPDSYLNEIPPAPTKSSRVVCMMTTKADRPFLIDAARNFCAFVTALGEAAPDWSFSVIGDFQSERIARHPPRIEWEGFLDEPLERLATSRAVALLSDYGFGFKTKLLEAICCGCWLLVTRKLYSRLPPEVQEHALVVDPTSSASALAALESCRAPFPKNDANARLRARAYSALDDALGTRS